MRTTTISKETYLQRMETLRRRMEKAYSGPVDSVIRKYFKDAADHVKSHGIHAAQRKVHGDHVLNGLTTVMQSLYRKAVAMSIKKPVVSTKDFPSWVQIVYAFLDRYILNKVVLPISQTTIEQVNQLLQEGIENGWGSAEMVKRLEDSELPAWRARLIVRTESVRAANVAAMVKAAQSPWEMEKQWIAVNDNRTRLTHSNHGGVDGERIDFLDKYSNGLYFPGDPTGPAKETCNCRCTQGFFAKRDENDNFIRRTASPDLTLAKLLG